MTNGKSSLFSILAVSSFMVFGLICGASKASADASTSSSSMAVAPVAGGVSAIEAVGSYFDWGQGRDGFGYCYEWTSDGRVLNQGMPVDVNICEHRRPSRPTWSFGRDGFGYCYRLTPKGHFMNNGQPINNSFCERIQPSYYSWARSRNGYTRCYQFTPQGRVMNAGQPVPNNYCR